MGGAVTPSKSRKSLLRWQHGGGSSVGGDLEENKIHFLAAEPVTGFERLRGRVY